MGEGKELREFMRDYNGNRSKQLKRVISTIVMLSNRPYSILELAQKHGVHTKTVRRDMRAIEELEIPLYESSSYLDTQNVGLWRVDRHWMRKFI